MYLAFSADCFPLPISYVNVMYPHYSSYTIKSQYISMLSNKARKPWTSAKSVNKRIKGNEEKIKEKISHYHLHFYQYQVVIINNSSLIIPNTYRCWLEINHAVRIITENFFLWYSFLLLASKLNRWLAIDLFVGNSNLQHQSSQV